MRIRSGGSRTGVRDPVRDVGGPGGGLPGYAADIPENRKEREKFHRIVTYPATERGIITENPGGAGGTARRRGSETKL